MKDESINHLGRNRKNAGGNDSQKLTHPGISPDRAVQPEKSKNQYRRHGCKKHQRLEIVKEAGSYQNKVIKFKPCK